MLQNNRFTLALVNRAHLPPRCSDGAVPIVQFGDFGCRSCARVADTLQSFRHQNDGVIVFSYRHFPISSMRRHGVQAAEAAECARAQGRFWPMHDLLIANQERLSLWDLYYYAEYIGLDMARFDREMVDGCHATTVRSHVYRGTLAGVRRTPTYFVAGMLVDSAGGLESLFEATQHVLTQRHCASFPIN